MKLRWLTKKLNECIEDGLIELKRGIVISEKDMREYPGHYPVYSSSSQNNGLFGTYGKYMFDEELITWSVDGGGYFFYRPKHRFSVTNVVGILKLHTTDLIYKFVYYYLVWQRSRLEFDYVKKAHPSVIKDLYEIAFPPLSIQQKIVKILDTIQEAVEVQEKIIEKTKELKKSLMAEFFKYGGPSFRKGRKLKKTEIGEIPEDWEVVRLGDNIEKPQYGISISATDENTGTKLLRITDIQEEKVDWTSVPFCKCIKDEIEKYQLKEGDIVIARIGATTGKSYFVKNVPQSVFGSYLIRIRAKDNLNPDYLSYYFQTDIYWFQLNLAKGGKLKGGINIPLIEDLKIPLPPLPEQQEIAEILQTIDQKIEIEKRKKELYEELFKTMLNKIMSQEIDINLLDY